MSSQHNHLVTVSLDGAPLGVFDTRTGGETTAEVTKYRPGGMARQKRRSGLREYADVVVSRNWEEERDAGPARVAETRVGRGVVTVSDQRLNADGAIVGTPTTWTGTLSGVNSPEANSDSNDADMLELTVVVTEKV